MAWVFLCPAHLCTTCSAFQSELEALEKKGRVHAIQQPAALTVFTMLVLGSAGTVRELKTRRPNRDDAEARRSEAGTTSGGRVERCASGE